MAGAEGVDIEGGVVGVCRRAVWIWTSCGTGRMNSRLRTMQQKTDLGLLFLLFLFYVLYLSFYALATRFIC